MPVDEVSMGTEAESKLLEGSGMFTLSTPLGETGSEMVESQHYWLDLGQTLPQVEQYNLPQLTERKEFWSFLC